ncbi:anthranilate synthase component I family protein [Halopenitus sp. H-Gu1]|uniref:anthranilate synthase component I family protein n=1 Tax=Halopenitus sp. H-Gu1 TaxID=3242697 RepID=UPI00359CE003
MRLLTDRDAFRDVAVDAPAGARVPVEARLEIPDPYLGYRRARKGPGGVFLETAGGHPGWSYFGVDPVERLQVSSEAVLADRERVMRTDTASHNADTSPTLAALEELVADERLVRGDCTVPYPCGAIGWIAYDVARELEDLPESAVDDRDLPRLQFAVYDTLAAWESPQDSPVELRIVRCPTVPGSAEHGTGLDGAFEPDDLDDIDRIHAEAVEALETFADRIRDGDPDVDSAPVSADVATFESDCGRDAFGDRVRRVKDYVRAGDTFQANVSQRLVAPAAVHPVEAFDALRRVNPAPYSGLLEFDWDGRGVDLVSASPELLLERDGDRLVTEPIAGTRPRGETPEADAALEAELRADEKERAEHAMLVDLERNDLGAVCAFGTVDVSEYRRVDRYSEVMHLVSLVEGRARADVTLADAVAACFPGGTITGAPKPRTMGIIDEVEATRRGPYTGSMAILGFDGRATFNILIRTLVRHADEYHLRVGAGIVHDSEPDAEYDETLDKARGLITAVDEALADEELRVETPASTDRDRDGRPTDG